MGHFRPIQPVLSAGSCPLRPESVSLWLPLMSTRPTNGGKDTVATPGWRTNPLTAYVLVIMLAAGGHHQSVAVGYPDQGSCLAAADRLRHKKKTHVECLKFVQGK